jgi:hypothetical protein
VGAGGHSPGLPAPTSVFLLSLGAMPLFRTPTDDLVRYAELNGQGLGHRLFRFYKSDPRGRNVFRLVDGSFTENEPNDINEISKVYWGGSENFVTDAEADALVAAGYTVLEGVFVLGSSYSSDLDGGAVLGAGQDQGA